MWKAKITSIKSDPSANVALTSFQYYHTDGRTKDITERISNPDSIQEIVFNGIRELERVDSINNLISNPTIGDVVIPTPVQPTQAEKDLQNFQKWLGLVQLLSAAKQLGWITGSEQVVLDAKAKVMALGATNIPKLFN